MRHAPFALQCRQSVLEAVRTDPVDDLAEHLDQPAVGVVGEARVLRARGQALDRLVVEPEVEDRVHHPRHRDRRAGAHRDEQWVGRVAESLAGLLFEPADVLRDLGFEPVWQVVLGHVGAARVGRDREPRRNRQPERGHLGEADPLAAEELATSVGGLVEVEHKTRRFAHSSDCYHARADLADRGKYVLAGRRGAIPALSERAPGAATGTRRATPASADANQNGVKRP